MEKNFMIFIIFHLFMKLSFIYGAKLHAFFIQFLFPPFKPSLLSPFLPSTAADPPARISSTPSKRYIPRFPGPHRDSGNSVPYSICSSQKMPLSAPSAGNRKAGSRLFDTETDSDTAPDNPASPVP